MKIYTKTGDKGSTAMFAGKRIDKDSLRISSYGEVDELNSIIGEIINVSSKKDLTRKLLRIQNELFVLQSNLATLFDVKIKIPKITPAYCFRLEKEIDIWQKSLPELRNFILPGGGEVGAKLHIARTVARRAERTIVSLSKKEKVNAYALAYINRISDWFFVLARFVNLQEKKAEVRWMGRANLKSKTSGRP